MADKIITPFRILTDEECNEELKKFELEKKQNESRVDAVKGEKSTEYSMTVKKRPTNIKNKQNPFINACSKTFKFIKDNFGVNLNTNALMKESNGCIANHLDKYSLRPKIKAQISVGPLEAEIDSDDIVKILKDKVPKKTY